MSESPPPKKQRLDDTYEDDKTAVAMETERQHLSDITTKLFDEKKGEKNLKSFLHGITYQQKLLLITFLCGASSENEFSLITEDEKAEKVILCSNIDLSKECMEEQEIQINHVKETIFKNKNFLLYQLIQENDNNQEPNDCPKALINHLTNLSQLNQLADCLVNLCMKSKTLKQYSD
uniref:Uncharacterized protein n=1 Tax=Panagrolaimus sp. PS1159 TaxID=55785 RepID=A0AC35EYY1_9BILA